MAGGMTNEGIGGDDVGSSTVGNSRSRGIKSSCRQTRASQIRTPGSSRPTCRPCGGRTSSTWGTVAISHSGCSVSTSGESRRRQRRSRSISCLTTPPRQMATNETPTRPDSSPSATKTGFPRAPSSADRDLVGPGRRGTRKRLVHHGPTPHPASPPQRRRARASASRGLDTAFLEAPGGLAPRWRPPPVSSDGRRLDVRRGQWGTA